MKTQKSEKLEIKLPGEIIAIGPGTVPLSSASVSTTSIKDVIAGARRASKLGLFDEKEENIVNFHATE